MCSRVLRRGRFLGERRVRLFGPQPTSPPLRIACERLRSRRGAKQELERNRPLQARVFGLIDHPHTALAQLLQDAVVRDGLADQAGETVPLSAAIGSGRAITRAKAISQNRTTQPAAKTGLATSKSRPLGYRPMCRRGILCQGRQTIRRPQNRGEWRSRYLKQSVDPDIHPEDTRTIIRTASP